MMRCVAKTTRKKNQCSCDGREGRHHAVLVKAKIKYGPRKGEIIQVPLCIYHERALNRSKWGIHIFGEDGNQLTIHKIEGE